MRKHLRIGSQFGARMLAYAQHHQPSTEEPAP